MISHWLKFTCTYLLINLSFFMSDYVRFCILVVHLDCSLEVINKLIVMTNMSAVKNTLMNAQNIWQAII